MRPIFCGNIEFDSRQGDLERLFRRYGKVERVDMKSGFAFIYMEDERDADDAIRALDRYEFGRKGRRLRVEWTKQDRSVRQPASSRKSSSNTRPSKTLFVINFDPYDTRTSDLERHFDSYGKILNIRIRRNFGFIQFESQEDATKALEATNQSKLMDRIITVEYAKDDDDRKNGNSSGGRDRSPRRRGDERGRSPSPYRRERGSPDYGRGRERGSPDYGRGRERGSPDYGRGRERGSPDYGRGRERGSPDYGRGRERVSPDYARGQDRSSPDYDRGRDRSSPDHGRRRDRGSPDHGRGRDRGSPNHGRGRSRSPSRHREDGSSPDRGRGTSPGVNGKGRAWNADHPRDAIPSPRRSSPKERGSSEYEQGAIVSPRSEGLIESPRERRVDVKPGMRQDSPGHSGTESPPARSDKSARSRSRS